MSSRDPGPVHVVGGSHGVSADCAEMVVLARRFGAVASDTLGAAVALHGYLVHPAVLTSSVFDPIGFAEFEAALLAALDGHPGLSWAGFACGGIDGQLRLAAAAYAQADALYGTAHDAIFGAVDAVPALAAAAAVLARGGDPIRAAQAVVAHDPQLADLLVDVLGVPALLRAAGEGIPDGHGVVRGAGIDRFGTAAAPPRSLTDVVGELARRSDDTRHGAIDVRVLTLPDGSRRAIVDITGTKSWDPLPTSDITSLTTNGRALVGEPTAYEGGVLAAMHAAGVRPSDDVMLVGHSEGGMVAVTTARDARARAEFNITHVVTAGAPVGLTVGAIPAGVQVLALENSRDVVPHLDGVRNPDRANVTTVTGARGDGTILGDHDVGATYVPLAADANASPNASIRDFLASADGFFRATTVETHTYQIERRY